MTYVYYHIGRYNQSGLSRNGKKRLNKSLSFIKICIYISTFTLPLVLRTCYTNDIANAMQMLCKRYANAMQCYAIAMQVLCKRYTNAMQKLCTCYENEMQMRCKRYANAM